MIDRPFSLDEARASGTSARQLQGAGWKRLGPRTYARSGLFVDPLLELQAVLHRLPPGAAFSGNTAGWLRGLDLPPCDPIEVTVPQATGVWARAGLSVRRAAFEPGEAEIFRGLPVTSALRTVADLGRRPPFVEAAVRVDMALHAGLATLPELWAWIARHRGHRGVGLLRRVLEVAEPATESPMETRLRLALIRAGLPRPEVQVPLHDTSGRLLGRVDLYYPEARLAIEYDGAIHATQLAQHNRRQNDLLAAGYTLLRFTGDLAGAAAETRAALTRARASSRTRKRVA